MLLPCVPAAVPATLCNGTKVSNIIVIYIKHRETEEETLITSARETEIIVLTALYAQNLNDEVCGSSKNEYTLLNKFN